MDLPGHVNCVQVIAEAVQKDFRKRQRVQRDSALWSAQSPLNRALGMPNLRDEEGSAEIREQFSRVPCESPAEEEGLRRLDEKEEAEAKGKKLIIPLIKVAIG